MPFRGHDGKELEVYGDPLARFFELEAAFEKERGFLGDAVPLRLVAANLVVSPGEPEALAATVRAKTEELRKLLPFWSHIVPAIQLLLAAVLMQRGYDPAEFVAEVERVRKIMRELRMRRMEVYETVAVLALRIRNEGAPIERAQVERMREIYAEMKRHHWLLTGPEDLPACAFLAGVDKSPEQLAAHANAIYELLLARAKLWRGDPLQTASNMLALSPLEPELLTDRFTRLATNFDAAGYRVRQGEYDEVAVLCFLAQPAERIVGIVSQYAGEIRERLSWTGRADAFGLAANLAFVRLVGGEGELGILADAKALLDMQTVIAARQAAASAAAAGQA